MPAMKSMYVLPSTSVSVQPWPRAMPAPSRARRIAARARRDAARARRSGASAVRLRGDGRSSRHRREPPGEVVGDARRRLLAIEREARPGVEIEEHDRAGRRDDGVATIDLEAQRGGRL